MKRIQDFDIKGKNVLVRCDFNVPISREGDVLNDFRIRMALPTIKYLVEKKARVILMSHLETRGKTFSLERLIPKLEELLNRKIIFFAEYLKKGARAEMEKVDLGEIILLENLRFNKEEKENDEGFAKNISELGDIFINEAFSSCHREHSSIVGVPKHLPKAPGFLLEKELKIFSDVLKNPAHPFVAIMGGVKINTKIKTILNILDVVDDLLLGSKMGEVILAQKGILAGREFSPEELVKNIDLKNPKIHLPVDGVIDSQKIVDIRSLKKEENIFDIGPRTIESFKKIIKKAKTILWNGALGMFEDSIFEKGTAEIARAIVESSAFKIAGGGETISSINQFGLADKFDFLSTGGGAMLEFLAGEKLPGVEALKDNYGD